MRDLTVCGFMGLIPADWCDAVSTFTTQSQALFMRPEGRALKVTLNGRNGTVWCLYCTVSMPPLSKCSLSDREAFKCL